MNEIPMTEDCVIKIQTSLKPTVMVCGYISEGKTAIIDCLEPESDSYDLVEFCFPPPRREEVLAKKQEIYKEARNRNNVALIIFVMEATSIKKYHAESYQFFVNELFQKPPPVILVLTRGEVFLPSQAYVKDSIDHFERVGMKSADQLLTCFGKGGFMESEYEPLRKNSTTDLLSSINKFMNLNYDVTFSDYDQISPDLKVPPSEWNMMMASPASIEEQFRNVPPRARPSLWSLIINWFPFFKSRDGLPPEKNQQGNSLSDTPSDERVAQVCCKK